MKKVKNTLKSVVLAVVCLAMVFSILSPAPTVKAEDIIDEEAYRSPIEVAYKKNLTLSASPGQEYLIVLSGKDLGGRTVADIKADKASVKDRYMSIEDGFYYTCPSGDAGKITFTITLSGSGKRTVKKKCAINFIKYVNPLKKTSFLDSDIIEQYQADSYAFVDRTASKKSKETVRFKTKNGWKIVSIRFEYSTEKEAKSLKVKNNADFIYPADLSGRGDFIIKVKNKETGFTETMLLVTLFPYTNER